MTNKDFVDCGWKEALANADRGPLLHGYRLRHITFSAAAEKANGEGRQTHGRVLALLANACSMELSPDSVSEPFKPFADFRPGGGGCSSTLVSFSEGDLAFFGLIIEEAEEPWLKTRLTDILWLTHQPRDVNFALVAIDAYRSIPLDEKIWAHGASDCWKRAIGLARMLKGGPGERLKEMEDAIMDSFHAATRDTSILALDLANFLKDTRLGGSHAADLARGLKSIVPAVDGDWRPCDVRELLQAALDWSEAAGIDSESTPIKVQIAKNLENEAAIRTASGEHIVAARLREEAIKRYRSIPRSERVNHAVDGQLIKMQGSLSESRKQSLDSMTPVETPGVNISQLIQEARNAVKGKEPIEALRVFANIDPGANRKQLREIAEHLLQEYPIHALFRTEVMSPDGRVVAKQPGMNFRDTPSTDDDAGITFEMLRNYRFDIAIVAQSRILPALETLHLEHRLREADFVAFARQSLVVPTGRELLFGKALFAGFDHDFITALHILAPQIEHMVRSHLKQAGVKTTTLDSHGIETENGLSSLMELPETTKIFGEDLCFEIKALFCDPAGPNLRNNVAHGLLDDKACRSPYAVYAWWLGLKLVLNTLWNALNDETEGGE